MIRAIAFASLLASACITSTAIQCGDDLVCPNTQRCDLKHHSCITSDQMTECATMPDRSPCTLPGQPGSCTDQVCLPAACGNKRLDLDEVCDDGNTADGDGCSADCKSDESCGNKILDSSARETCDDGNHVDHDGCSSACQLESLAWTPLADPEPRTGVQAVYDAARDVVVMFGGADSAPSDNSIEAPSNIVAEWSGVWRDRVLAAPPPERSRFGMAYDFDRKRVVIHGGTSTTVDAIGDTWEWDGAHWSHTTDGPAVFDAAMTYDAHRRRVVLFGGRTDTNTSPTNAATWEYDGVTWTQATPTTSPPARYKPMMTYDASRGVVVMYGGLVGPDFFATTDVWEYDGTTWIDRTPTSGAQPPDVVLAGFRFLPGRGTCVLYGGLVNDSTHGSDEMWEWNGVSWKKFAGTTPSLRGAHAMSDDGHGGLLVFGGRTDGSTQGDTWRFDGTAWAPVAAPSPRSALTAATEFDQGKVVIFGGTRNGTLLAETWELDARGWKLGSAGPPPTQIPNMVYDSTRSQLVLFGGLLSGGTGSDLTWVRTASTWTSHHPSPSPPARAMHGMAFDAARGVTVVFGGQAVDGSLLADTWTWDGTAWMQRTPAHSPTPRYGFAMAYDPIRERVVLFGGSLGSGFATVVSDTWTWDGTDWHEESPAAHPGFRFLPTFVWDPGVGALVIAGGLISFSAGDLFDTWQWLGDRWEEIGTTTRPSGRYGVAGFTSPDGAGVVLFGGGSTVSLGTDLGDRWRLRRDGPRGSDGCTIAADVDGDQLTACDDPDCWATCQPACPPGTSCPPTSPHCGDGTCSAFETHHTCPADCPTATPVCGDFVCDAGETCPGDCP